MLDWLGKGYKAFQRLVPSCVWASSYFAMAYTTSFSFLAHFNDKKKLSKTPKTCQNFISTLAKVLNVPIALKGINYYSEVF